MFTPNYTISDQILSHLSQIAEIKALVERSTLLPEREVFLRRAAIIKMAHTSTSIEGNQLQEYQVAQVVEGKPVNAEEKQIREVRNYLSGLREVDTLARTQPDFTSKNILALHKTVIGGLVEKRKRAFSARDLCIL